VLEAAPDHFDALHLRLAKTQGGQIGEAHRLMSAAFKLNPRGAERRVGALCRRLADHQAAARIAGACIGCGWLLSQSRAAR
jgi:hypothetical protein